MKHLIHSSSSLSSFSKILPFFKISFLNQEEQKYTYVYINATLQKVIYGSELQTLPNQLCVRALRFNLVRTELSYLCLYTWSFSKIDFCIF